jgi:hypothetical protein
MRVNLEGPARANRVAIEIVVGDAIDLAVRFPGATTGVEVGGRPVLDLATIARPPDPAIALPAVDVAWMPEARAAIVLHAEAVRWAELEAIVSSLQPADEAAWQQAIGSTPTPYVPPAPADHPVFAVFGFVPDGMTVTAHAMDGPSAGTTMLIMQTADPLPSLYSLWVTAPPGSDGTLGPKEWMTVAGTPIPVGTSGENDGNYSTNAPLGDGGVHVSAFRVQKQQLVQVLAGIRQVGEADWQAFVAAHPIAPVPPRPS